MRSPHRNAEPEMIGMDPDDLLAAEIEGLAWHESAPSFEAVVIDEKGEPLRIVATDPRPGQRTSFGSRNGKTVNQSNAGATKPKPAPSLVLWSSTCPIYHLPRSSCECCPRM